MRSWLRFPVLPWEFSLAGEDPHSDHYQGEVTVPYWRPNRRSQLHFSHNQEGDNNVYMDMWWHWRGGGGGHIINEKIYKHGTGKIFGFINQPLQEYIWPIQTQFLIFFFELQNTLCTEVELPQNIILYFIRE
jgi:hypothetical protein